MEGDANLRRTLDIDKCLPVLEVVETNWCGSNCRKWNEFTCCCYDKDQALARRQCGCSDFGANLSGGFLRQAEAYGETVALATLVKNKRI